MRRKNPARKSGGPKIKIREKSILPKPDPKLSETVVGPFPIPVRGTEGLEAPLLCVLILGHPLMRLRHLSSSCLLGERFCVPCMEKPQNWAIPPVRLQGGSGTEPEPATGTVGTVFPETESGTGTAGTVFQEPKPLNCTETQKNPFCRGTVRTENRNRWNRSTPEP